MTQQRIIDAAQGKSNGSGIVVLRFQSPQSGAAWVGTVSVPQADLGASFTAYLNAETGIPLGSWLGRSFIGPLYINAGEFLVIAGEGLSHNTLYTGTFIGVSDDSDRLPFVSPDPAVSSLSLDVLIAQTVQANQFVGGSFSGTTYTGDNFVGGTFTGEFDGTLNGVIAAPTVHYVSDIGEPPFENRWQNFGSTYGNARFWLDAQGMVHLAGTIKTLPGVTPIPSVAFTLPVGFTPAFGADTEFPAIVGSMFSRIDVNHAGQVNVGVISSPPADSYAGLDGISFPTFT